MKLTNTNQGRLVIMVHDSKDQTPQYVYVVPSGESFDPTDVGLVLIESLKEIEV